MIPTVPLDVCIAFFFGSLIACCAARQIRRQQPPVFSRYVLMGAGYCLWFFITVIFFYLKYPDWMWAYFLDASRLSPWVVLPIFGLAIVLSGTVGAITSQALIAEGKLRWAIGFCVVAFLVHGAVLALTWRQYNAIGTWGEFYSGRAIPLQYYPGFKTQMNIAGALEGLPLVALVAYLIVTGRRRPSGGTSSLKS